MKVLKSKEKSGDYYFSGFQLDHCFCPDHCLIGLVILYTIIQMDRLYIDEISLEYFSDIHDGNAKESFSSKELLRTYPDPESFCRSIDVNQLALWQIDLVDETMINGGTGAEVRVMTESEDINFNRFFFDVERETHNYDSCISDVIAYLMKNEKVNKRNAEMMLQDLKGHVDLYEEFESHIKQGKYIYPDQPILVEGYSVQMLMEKVGWHPIGAYRAMVMLRENKEQALKRIKQGIIRK